MKKDTETIKMEFPIFYDFNIPPKTLKKFKELYKKDKSKNLLERINYFTTQNPELFNKKVGFAPIVYSNFWAVIAIQEIDYAFSVGLSYEYNHPEIMVIGATLSNIEYKNLINEIACYVRDKSPIEPNKDYSFINQYKSFELKENPKGKNLSKTKRPLLIIDSNEVLPIVPLSKSLIFKTYDEIIEEEYPCGYLWTFYINFADTDNLEILVADLR